MINSSQQITALLQYLYETEQEFCAQIWNPNVRKWSSHKLAIYENGIVIGKYLEQDSATFDFCNETISDDAIRTEIANYLERSIRSYSNKQYLDPLDFRKLDSDIKQRTDLSKKLISDWIDQYCGWFDYNIDNLPESHKRALVFLYYALCNYGFIKKHPLSEENDILKDLYKDVWDKQSQFYKYGLVTIDEKRELLPNVPSRVYDAVIDRTIRIKNTPTNLLKIFDEMLSSQIIKTLSVRLLNEKGWPGRIAFDYITEAVERGQPFDFSNLDCFSITKLYSAEYENCLFVIIDRENITFEELCKDFKIYDDTIVTQVVHLQYFSENDKYFISHIDHEYIFYSVEEYDNRLQNPMQKGTARPRLKSFKIDDSRIPFEYRCPNFRKDEYGNDLPAESIQFLCYVLECYFEHKDLLSEYFQKMLP